MHFTKHRMRWDETTRAILVCALKHSSTIKTDECTFLFSIRELVERERVRVCARACAHDNGQRNDRWTNQLHQNLWYSLSLLDWCWAFVYCLSSFRLLEQFEINSNGIDEIKTHIILHTQFRCTIVFLSIVFDDASAFVFFLWYGSVFFSFYSVFFSFQFVEWFICFSIASWSSSSLTIINIASDSHLFKRSRFRFELLNPFVLSLLHAKRMILVGKLAKSHFPSNFYKMRLWWFHCFTKLFKRSP